MKGHLISDADMREEWWGLWFGLICQLVETKLAFCFCVISMCAFTFCFLGKFLFNLCFVFDSLVTHVNIFCLWM